MNSMLTETEWCRGFVATLDEDGNETHQSMVFVANNRYPDDNEDDNIEGYFSVRPYEGDYK